MELILGLGGRDTLRFDQFLTNVQENVESLTDTRQQSFGCWELRHGMGEAFGLQQI